MEIEKLIDSLKNAQFITCAWIACLRQTKGIALIQLCEMPPQPWNSSQPTRTPASLPRKSRACGRHGR